ncbi:MULTISPECIES: hypothetical protein [unclassified Saccharibacter]|uniref:hypothetical protein n=1 Tax=unclassified Saccharibacter TaxID=2648722 RepID=UPI0013299AE2|nr:MULTISPECIES: hypothetical protein [unclassified Saccharibacter]MXV35435.1 hypothetical protein [Saccharibacter sp. EH611]MXV58095.1 hypothetical protein [Saccharibacter sp. EH70]MXV65369.1 hypothetical protein [Saccharibacter sp. EH60]
MLISIVWSLVLALHLLCMAYWVGGAFYCLQLRRATRLLEPAQATTVLLQSYSRYLRALWHVVPLAFITGIALFVRAGGHLPWPYHLMSFCGVMMAIAFLTMFFGPLKTARRAIRPQPQTFVTLHRRTAIMLFWGVVAVLSGSFGHGF